MPSNPALPLTKSTFARVSQRFARVLQALLVSLSLLVAPAYGANIIHEFYVPLPEAQVKTALVSIEPAAGIVGNTIESVISIVVTGSGSVVHYDEWEDGYEIDLNNPAQSTTKIWGDGNDANGIPPGYVHDPASFSAGAVIILRNQIPLPRNPATLFYDGRDRFGGTKALVVSRASWATTPGTVLAGANEVQATMDFGTNFVSPVGDDVSAASMFEFVGMFVMARDDATSVTIDTDGPGVTAPFTIALNRGESYLVNGAVKKGATVTSTKPVQVDLITGDIGARFESRRFTLYARDQWSNTTYSPLGTAANGDQSYAFIYNPNAGAITVNASTCIGTTSFSVPANGVYQYLLQKNCGAKFVTAGGEDFFGIVTVGANPTANNVHDWGFTMVPSDNLTTQAVVGWGPGSSDLTQNGSPVWVTPTKATTVYVDYNGDGLGVVDDGHGGHCDTTIALGALETGRITDPDKDGTAMKLYTLDGANIAVAWGQDAATAGPALPFLDCGTTVLPFPVPILKKTAALVVDTGTTGMSVGDTVEYTVTVDNHGLLPLGNLIVLDPLHPSLTYVASSTKRDNVTIPDDVSGTPFPLDGSGYTIPIILRGGTTVFKYRVTINAAGSITNTVNNQTYNLNSDATVSVPTGPGSTPCTISFTTAGGTNVSTYTAGASVYATVNDPDGNTNAGTQETMMASVTNSATGDAELIMLTETGVNTGLFRNTVGLLTSTSTGSASQDGTLKVAIGNTISVSHLDTTYGETCVNTATIAPSTQNKYLYLSDPSQALDRVDPVATSDATTASTAALGVGAGTVTVDHTSSGSTPAAATSLSISHLTNSGSNTFMLVSVTVGGEVDTGGTAASVGTVLYGTQSMIFVNGVSDGTSAIRTELWKLANPTQGTASVVITLAGGASKPIAAAVTTFFGVDGTTPLGTMVTAASTGTSPTTKPTLSVTSAVGDLVFDVVGVDGDGAGTPPPALTAGTGQSTPLWAASSTNRIGGSGSTKTATTTSTAMSWNFTGNQQWVIGGIAIKPAPGGGTPTATFTQAPAFQAAFTMPIGATPAVTAYYTVATGSMPASPTVTATLKKNGTAFATSTSASASGGLMTFAFGALGSAVNFVANDVITMDITTTQAGVTFTVDFDSTTKPSKITLPTTTVISIGSLGVYDAPSPGGSLITAPTAGTTAYVRSTVSDPFGAYDITSLGLNINGPGVSGDVTTTLTAGSVVSSTASSKTYEYVWNVGQTTGTYDITVTANEGTEGIISTAGTSVSVTMLDLGTPSTTEFTTGSNGPGTPTYTGNETVCVRITDLDQNTNASVAETITAVITSLSGDSELVTLTETGPNTGVFVVTIPASTTAGTGNNNGTLHAVLGDVLTVNYVDPTDATDTSNDTATIPNSVPAISVNKTRVLPADGVAVFGEAVQYTVQVTNTGNTSLAGVTLVDTFPSANLTFVGATGNPTTVPAGTLTWNIGGMASGQSLTYTINFTAGTSAALAVNTATATATGGITGNDTANVTITHPHITLSKTVLSPGGGTANVGDNVVFRITATNDGDTAISSLPIEDTYSGANFDFISATVSPDASGSGSLLWLDVTGAGTLAPAASVTIDVTLKAKGSAAPAINAAAANYTVDVNGDSPPTSSSNATITLVAATINGHVYNDKDQNSAFNGADVVIEGITVSLYTDPNGDGDPADGVLVAIAPTDASGVFDFPNLALGHYVAVESQPPGYASWSDTQGANDNRIAINVTTLTAFTGNNFFDYLPAPMSYASIAGKVWDDANASATVNGGELGIGNVAVDLVQDVNGNGTADPGEPVQDSTLTASDGTYSFGSLTAGNYVVVEHDLFGWYSTADAASPNNNQIPVVLTAGSNVTSKDFLDVLTGTVGGKVFHDVNGNGSYNAGTDAVLAGVDVIVTDSFGVAQTVTTDASGNWIATVPPGTTGVNVDQNDAQFTAVFSTGYTQTAGTDPNNITAVSGVNTPAGDDGFRQVGTITGHLYRDTNGNGVQDGGEPDLTGVDVLITAVDNSTQTVTTDGSGNWTATVPPGAATANIHQNDPQYPAGGVVTQGLDTTPITAVANTSTGSTPVGVYVAAIITGHLYSDTNGNGAQDGGEPDLANVDVLITDVLGNTQTVATSAGGNWIATVPPGATTANIDQNDPQYPAGSTITQGLDTTSITAVAGATTGSTPVGLYIPATVQGRIYNDTNGNGVKDGAETYLANIDVLITDSLGNTQTVTTNGSGLWTASVPPGTTTVNIDETDPQYPAGSNITQGLDTSSITAVAGTTTTATPVGVYVPATVSGHLYSDTNGNGTQDSGEPNLANIDVLITDSLGNTQTVVTNGSGAWTASVPPGATSANIDETDPQYPAGSAITQGADTSSITAVAGVTTSATPVGLYIAATVTGHLYTDTNGNGTQDSGEPNVAGVDVLITDSLGNTQTVTTSAGGNWTASVPPGTTTANIDETDPQYPTGGNITQGLDTTSITAVAGVSTGSTPVGIYIPATVEGYVYNDTNGNGAKDGAETYLANVDVLITDSLGNTQTVATDAGGHWTATVPPGTTSANIDETDPQYPAGSTITQGLDTTSITAVAGATTGSTPVGLYIPATVTGHLYVDTNGNGTQDSGEPDLAGVDVLITDSLGNTQTVTTSAGGDWTASVPPGTTTANVDETDPQFPAGGTITQGLDTTSITAVAGVSTGSTPVGVYIPATVTGHIYNDTNGNGAQDLGELNLANIGVLITDSLGNTQTVATNASGVWTATVPPGTTTANIDETDPDYLAGSAITQGLDTTSITAVAGASTGSTSVGLYIAATVSGHLYTDTNGNGTQDVGEPNLANVDVVITDSLSNTQTVSTNASGDWTASVPPGATSADVDENDPQFPAGANHTDGSDPTSFTAASGTTTDGGTDGYYIPATITGHLYVDTNGNGSQDSGELNLASVDVIITDVLGNTQTVSTNASGDWTASVPPGNTGVNVDNADPQFPVGATQTEGTDPSSVLAVAGVSTDAGVDGYVILATVAGHLYIDTNGNGTQDSGEPDLVGVDVVVTDSLSQTHTVTTDSSGDWTVNVPPGSTTADIDDADPQYPNGSTQTEGNDPTTGIIAVAGSSVSGGIDGFFIATSVHGHLYVDTNGNGTQDLGEPDLAGVDVIVSDANSNTQTVTTNSSGDWIASVPPGSSSADVDETDPQFPTGSTQTQGTDPAVITAVVGSSVGAVDDGYYLPGTVTGHLYSDTNGNGTQDSGEPNLAGIDVLITDSNGNTQTVTTNSSGDWTASVPPGTTTANIDETDPQYPAGSTITQGVDTTSIAAVAGASTGSTPVGLYVPASINGHLYVDTNGNGTQDSGEPNLANVDVVISDVLGNTQTVSTNASGDWTASVPPGSTTVDVDESDPQFPVGATQIEGTDPSSFTAVAGVTTSGGTDGYYIPATVTGHLYVDTNGNGTQDLGEPNIANTDVVITDSNSATQTVTTNATGDWTASVPPGSTSADVDESDTDFTAVVQSGYVHSQGTDPTSFVAVANSSVSGGVDGYFNPATTSGHLYVDTNGNAAQDLGEPNIANVDVVVTDSNGNTQTVTTNATGDWTATVPPGITSADVDESDADFIAVVLSGYVHSEGTDPTVFSAVAHTTTDGGTDGYFNPAEIKGHIYADTNGNGTQDLGELDLADVDVLITDSLGNTQTVATNASGNWTASVPPGTTAANIDETDPQYPAGSTVTQGLDTTSITAVAGTSTGSTPVGLYVPATVAGHIYADTNGNGAQDVGEPNLANIDVLITDSLGNTQTVATNASGDWTASVPPGTTTANIDETDPQYPAGSTVTQGLDTTSITAVAGASTGSTPVGLYISATIGGHLYVDTNGNGTQDVGESNLASVDVIITDSNGNTQTVATNASGDWTATVPPGSTLVVVDESDADFTAVVLSGFVHSEGDEPTSVTAVAGVTTNGGTDGYFNPATLSGHLYADTNGNGTQDVGEPNLANVDVIITDVNGNAQTVATNGSGVWTATVPPGSTSVNVDETDANFTAVIHSGYVHSEGNDPTVVTAVAHTSTDGGTDGYFNPATVTGHLYVDTNRTGAQDLSEPDLANVDVLITDSNGNTQTVTTDANGDWTALVPPGSTTADVDENDADFTALVLSGYLQTDGSDPTVVTAVAGSTTYGGTDGYFNPATITGHVYVDTNGNGTQDLGEPDLANVYVIIRDSNLNLQSVTTDASGNWTAQVPPGSTSAHVDDTDPNFTAVVLSGYAQTEGTDPTVDIAVAHATTDFGIDGFFNPATASGHLYVDTNGNGTQNVGEPDLADVDVIITDVNGNTQTVTTNAAGVWTATVAPGATSANIDNTDPDFTSAVLAGFVQTEGNDPTLFTAVEHTTTNGGTDGYFNPASISGHLFVDTNGNGTQQVGEPNLADVSVEILDSNGNTQTVTTNASGDWTAQVPPGSVSADVDESDPDFTALVLSGYVHSAGDDPTVCTAIVGAANDGGTDGYFNPATITGHLYVDLNNNGTQDSGEPDLLNVDVKVTDVNGNVQTVTTDTNGEWSATVPPGLASAQVDQTDPDFSSVVISGFVQTEGTDPTSVTAVAHATTFTDNDGFFNPTIITGRLYVDTNGNGTHDIGEPPIPNVDVIVTDVYGSHYTATTNSSGDWSVLVPEGAASIDVDESDPDFALLVHSGYVHTEGDDPTAVTTSIGIATDGGSDGYYNPSIATGRLYLDVNGSGTQDIGEAGIADVSVSVLDANGATHVVTTNALGVWSVAVPPGSTEATVVVSDPDFIAVVPPGGYFQTEGSDPTTFNAVAGQTSSGGNDGYYVPGTVAGLVYWDTNGNGTQDSGEPGIPDVGVIVVDSNGTSQTATTNSLGRWTAAVPQGITSVDVDESSAGYIQHVPVGSTQTEGTDPTMVFATAGLAVTDAGNDGYHITGTLSISGQVRDDFNINGVLADNDTPWKGVTVELYIDFNDNGVLDSGDTLVTTTVTDSNGQYTFGNLADGQYLVHEVNPRNAVSTGDKDGGNADEVLVVLSGANSTGNDFLDAIDPSGYIYDSVTGAIIPGGSISVSGPGSVTILMNGSVGQYSFITDGTAGVYTMTVTPPSGYRIDPARPAQSGTLDPTGHGDPYALGSDENTLNPGYLVAHDAPGNPYYLSFDLAAGDPLVINNNIPVILIKPDTYVYWKDVTPGAGGTPTSNNDCDQNNDLLEYALCGDPATAVQVRPLFSVEKNGAHFDAVFKRAAGTSDVTYTLEVIANLANSPAGWAASNIVPVVTPNLDGSETVTYPSVDTSSAINGQGTAFARLRVTQTGAPNATAATETFGWTFRNAPSVCETFSHPYLKKDIFTGCVDGVSGSTLDVSTSAGSTSISAQFVPGAQYFIEVVSGANEGQRWEVDEAACTANSIVLDAASTLNTKPTVPVTLAGNSIAIRAHFTLGELFDKDVFVGTNNALTADRLLFFDVPTKSFRIIWLAVGPSTRKWINVADATLTDRGSRIIDNGEGFFVHPRNGALQLTFSGVVRANAFARPVPQGNDFLAGGWPITQSPNDRSMTLANGFTGSRNPLVADRMLFWAGDGSLTAEGYVSHFLLQSNTRNQWTPEGNATLINENALPLLGSMRAVMFKSMNGKANFIMPRAWTP